MNYSVWELLKQKVYRGQREKLTEPELKRKLIESWREIGIDDRKCISAWKKRLKLVRQQSGGPIDHLP